MKNYIFCLVVLAFLTGTNISGQSKKLFDIFSYTSPAGYTSSISNGSLFLNKTEGKSYCQIFLSPSTNSQSSPEKDFNMYWDYFARNASQGVGDPETKEKDSTNGWQVVFGAARGVYNKKTFVVTVSSFTKGNITYSVNAVFTDQKYMQPIQDFIAKVIPDEKKFAGNKTAPVTQNNQAGTNPIPTGKMRITKSTTTFDDGWTSTITDEFVKATNQQTELRLYYINKALDDARPNTIDAPEYYWRQYVEPYFTVSSPQKWSGVEYPVIYFMQGNAVEKATGKKCFVAIKIVYGGGARPIVTIAPNESVYHQLFPHPNNLDPMLNGNRFAVSTQDIIGTWNGSGGGGVEYYNAYSGTYAGMSAVSSTDEFIFNSNGTYSSRFRSASMNNSGAQFGGQDFKGQYSVNDWTITATNRHNGKTTAFKAHLIAIKNGYLLYMEDPENKSMNYTLFKSK